MLRLLVFSCIFSILSCSQNTAVSKKLSGCDSLVINFNDLQTGSTTRTVNTTSKQAINRLSEFVSARETELFKCGYDGNMLFFEKGKMVSDVSFNYSLEDCRHFMLVADEKLTSTKMSNEAADFLKSLAEGKNVY